MISQETRPKHTDAERGSIEELKNFNGADVDIALQAFGGHVVVDLDPDTEKKLLRKIDLNLMPVSLRAKGNLLTANGLFLTLHASSFFASSICLISSIRQASHMRVSWGFRKI